MHDTTGKHTSGYSDGKSKVGPSVSMQPFASRDHPSGMCNSDLHHHTMQSINYCMHIYPCYAKAEEAFDEINCMPIHLDSTHATHVLIDTGKVFPCTDAKSFQSLL